MGVGLWVCLWVGIVIVVGGGGSNWEGRNERVEGCSALGKEALPVHVHVKATEGSVCMCVCVCFGVLGWGRGGWIFES